MFDEVLIQSWVLELETERKSEHTIKSYVGGVRQFLAWCEENGVPAELDRATVEAFQRGLLHAGLSPTTVVARQLALRRYAAFLVDEGELSTDPLVGIRRPKVDVKIVQPLSRDQVRALLAACRGRRLSDRRDEAMLRLMAETGLRAAEVVNLTVRDIDLENRSAVVRRGKGGKGRVVPMSITTAAALGRYLRLRRSHVLAAREQLWLGERGKAFSYYALRGVVARRGDLAGIPGLHPHVLRHTAAHHWLAQGGSEQGLMAVAGWARPDMLVRYTAARASERAVAEFHALDLGRW